MTDLKPKAMNYTEAVSYLRSLPPFIPRKLAPGEELFNLDAIRCLLKHLGNPEKQLRFVHIAGTNGKGSTASFLTGILTEAGHRTGLFTSPAVLCPTEQIRIGTDDISQDDYARIISYIRPHCEKMAAAGEGSPSEFEILTAAAFLYFTEQKCDIVVLETGLGGRLDATNIIPAPLLCIFTPVSLEHTDLLGDTLEKIAREKAGIIKPGTAVLTSPQDPEVMHVFQETCTRLDVPLYTEIPALDEKCGEILKEAMAAPYQAENAALAAEAARLLQPDTAKEAIRLGISRMKWPCRFELIRTSPDVIIDGSHNPAGVKTLAEALRTYYPGKKIRFITGILRDKNVKEMLSHIMPLAACFYTVTPPSPRALPAEELAEILRDFMTAGSCGPCEIRSFENPEDAVRGILKKSGADDIICAFGSLYSAGGLRSYFLS